MLKYRKFHLKCSRFRRCEFPPNESLHSTNEQIEFKCAFDLSVDIKSEINSRHSLCFPYNTQIPAFEWLIVQNELIHTFSVYKSMILSIPWAACLLVGWFFFSFSFHPWTRSIIELRTKHIFSYPAFVQNTQFNDKLNTMDNIPLHSITIRKFMQIIRFGVNGKRIARW